MRIATGSIVIDGATKGKYEFEYADEVAFAYNPLYLNIRLTNSYITTLKVVFKVGNGIGDNTKSIDVALYKGQARVFYSRILELFFTNVKRIRSKKVNISIKSGSTTIQEFSHIVLWGSLSIGERFDNYGVYKFDARRPYLERTRVWFKNFPFTVTLFQAAESGNAPRIKAMYDSKGYDDSLKIHSPWFLIYAFEICDITSSSILSVITELPAGKTLDCVVYADDKQKFFGLFDEDQLCESWPDQNNGIFGSQWFNASDGKARGDMVWGFPGDRAYFRYDRQTNRMIEYDYGCCSDNGLFELTPAFTFPDAVESAVYRQDAPFGVTKSSVFDSTFDYTFFNSGEFTIITNLLINNQTEGHYLRWIDRFGCFQYYLFTKGESTIKTKLSSSTIDERNSNLGMWYPNHSRTTHIDGTPTCKGQACALTKEIYDYVSTIVTSPIIDLYMGKTKSGEEIWCPVTIEASSYKIKDKDVLHNLEITFSLPDTQAQTL